MAFFVIEQLHLIAYLVKNHNMPMFSEYEKVRFLRVTAKLVRCLSYTDYLAVICIATHS